MLKKEDILILKPSEWAVDYALELALLKVDHLYGGEKRLLSERYDSLYKGDLARNVVIEWMKTNLKTIKLDAKTSLWHAVSPCDDAKQTNEPDYGWDIMHNVNHAIEVEPNKFEFENPNAYFVEVKSHSLHMQNGKHTPLEDVIRKYDAIVPVKYKKGEVILPGANCATEIFVQAFHNRRDMKQNIDEEKLKNELNEILSMKEKQKYLKEFLSIGERYPRVLVAGWFFGTDIPDVAKKFNPPIRSYCKRNCWRAPLIQARPMQDYTLLR